MFTLIGKVQQLGSSLGLYTSSRNFLVCLLRVRSKLEHNYSKLRDESPELDSTSPDKNLGESVLRVHEKHTKLLAELAESIRLFLKNVQDFPHFISEYGKPPMIEFSEYIDVSPCICCHTARAIKNTAEIIDRFSAW